MPRRQRCVVEGLPHHVTQRGVDRCAAFLSDTDRLTYARLLRDNLGSAGVRVLGWCLMTNHVHLVVLPELADSLALLLRRVHGRYAQYFNVRSGRTGHLWQNRYFACPLGPAHLWSALAYVDCNPVRARMVRTAAEYVWSSAGAHISGRDSMGILDLDWWRKQTIGSDWERYLRGFEFDPELEKCTYSGRPFGDRDLVTSIAERFERSWTRGRPKKKANPSVSQPAQQRLFAAG